MRGHLAYARFEIIGRDENRHLEFAYTWLQDVGKCQHYPNRLEVCKTYLHRESYFTGDLLLPGCGYTFEAVVCSEKLLEKKPRTEQTQTIHHFEV